ncbi:AzlC family ABC transporter permease [Fuscibacter oryzae]|uniref:AzlC family ABC transporter permease n=1 Tax=Fuscibacter oryzae TaxID=2803939 RepID=A0A8J7MTC2_9RHOB|nr:AzlC family ABC transporter permease [Fuscibacter oryzae]MBL4927004.1 AzlC family ABC transporter permease [Fuscibacter oryzae]
MIRAPFTLAGFGRGVRFGLALALPIGLYGLAFGLVAAQAGMGWGWATGFSTAIFSGSAQLATISVLQTGHATLTAVAATVLVMNARYLLFGATLQPWLSQAGPARALPSLLLLGDANWIITMRAIDAGEKDRAFLAGTGIPPLVVWLGGTVVGAMFGSILPDPKALGADLMLPAFAAAMMAVMVRGPASLVPVAVGAVSALGVGHLAGPGWGIVAAGLAGAGFAALTARPKGHANAA